MTTSQRIIHIALTVFVGACALADLRLLATWTFHASLGSHLGFTFYTVALIYTVYFGIRCIIEYHDDNTSDDA